MMDALINGLKQDFQSLNNPNGFIFVYIFFVALVSDIYVWIRHGTSVIGLLIKYKTVYLWENYDNIVPDVIKTLKLYKEMIKSFLCTNLVGVGVIIILILIITRYFTIYRFIND